MSQLAPPPPAPLGSQARLRVFLAIGSEVIDIGVRRLLESVPSIEVVPLLRSDCDVILVDGIAARGRLGSRIRHLQPPPSIVGLRPDGVAVDENVERYLSPGRWIAMSVNADGLVQALEAARPEPVATPSRNQSTSEICLTPREGEILGLICAGQTNQEIAATLFLSVNSVKSHIRTLYQKIGATRRSQAVVWGWERGY
ncbi:response regulator transcription factor [Nocardioides salsibiostraticola]